MIGAWWLQCPCLCALPAACRMLAPACMLCSLECPQTHTVNAGAWQGCAAAHCHKARTYQGMEVVRAMTISGMGAWEVA